MKKKIAVLACGWCDTFLLDFLDGMKRATEGKDIDLYVFNAYNYTEYSGFPNYTGFSVFSLINYEDYDGIVVLSDLISNPRFLEKERLRILKSKKPAISINKKMEGISCIRIDNYTGYYELLEHLIKIHGIKDIAYVSGKETSIDIAERYKAYTQILQDNNIPLDNQKIYSLNASDYHSAYHFFVQLIKSGQKLPQAFACANDYIAMALLKVCSENKIKVPEQLKIIGYDDLSHSRSIKPSLTTVKSNADLVGSEVISRLTYNTAGVQILRMKSSPVFRQSCGCSYPTTNDQSLLSLNILSEASHKEEFDTHIELISEIFTEAADVFTLLTNVENYFIKSHNFEGDNFCLFMKADWTSVLINSAESLPQNLTYGTQVQSICSVQGGVKYPREMIPVRELVPSKMKTEGSNVFLFLPIYHHSYVHGYFVAKNNLTMIANRYGYLWTRTLGTSIEHFRKKNMFKQMSQQYLKLSTRDALSGALNRQGLDKLAKPYYAQNKKNGLTTVLFFVDINKMKHINDQFGHLHGDLAVKTVAAAAMETVPKNWLTIRYGGDEFLIVGNSRNYNGEDYCTKIKERLASKTAVMHLPYTLSASVGTYSVPANSDLTLEQAVENVDSIMYEQKQAFHKDDDKKAEKKES